MGLIMGSQKIMGSDYGSNISVFQDSTNHVFEYASLLVDISFLAKEAASTGKAIFDHICEMT